MDEEHINYARQMRQMMTAFDSAATALIRARETYIARGYDQVITDETLGPGVVNANDVLGMVYITADLDTFLDATRRGVISKVRTDY